MDDNFEDFSKEKLADTLRQFYPSARQKPKNGQEVGDRYSKQLLINICSALNRFLQPPPNNLTWDPMHDSEFKPANKVFKGI